MGDTVYFLLAKLFGTLLNPYALFILGVLLGGVLLYSRRLAPWGRRLLTLTLVCYVIFAMAPVGPWMLSHLENRFPVVVRHDGPVAGIIVLGGATDTVLTRKRGLVELNSGAERMTELVRLSRLHPEAKLVFAGGSGRVFDRKPTEAEVAQRFFEEQGLNPARLIYEDRSRNTTESAAMTYRQLTPKDGETWILITSARHMPRAMGLFRRAGWKLTAHPVDHLTLPDGTYEAGLSWPGDLGYLNMALYEWAGLAVSYVRGRTNVLFPGPADGKTSQATAPMAEGSS